MPPKAQHAKLSPSSAYRWLVCTAAPEFEEQFPDSSSVYAEEGTLAHSVCEKLVTHTKAESDDALLARLTEERANPLWRDEMLATARAYDAVVEEICLRINAFYLMLEKTVDLSSYIPEGHGTCDCILLGHDTLWILDYKHGKGVVVEAERNPQMMLYALAALELCSPLVDNISTVGMSIIQPRIRDTPSEWVISAEGLREWGASVVRPAARAAYTGEDTKFVPGDHCRFCKGRAVCRARADGYLTLRGAQQRDRLTDAEACDVLDQADGLLDWVESLRAYVRDQILTGHQMPGWRVVEGVSRRIFSDTDKALAALREAGYDDAILYERNPRSLAELEKTVGKKRFAELMSGLIVKPTGKPTLVKDNDKRPDFSGAAADFKDIAGDKKRN